LPLSGSVSNFSHTDQHGIHTRTL